MNYIKEIERHYLTGCKIPHFIHLVLYNLVDTGFCSDNVIRNLKRLTLDNVSVFKSHYKKFKKLRNRNKYGIKICKKKLETIIECIELAFFKKYDYLEKRKQFNRQQKQLFKILIKKCNACLHCGTTEKLSIDHIVPLIKKGSNDINNLQILCISCNSKKGSK
ncbi:HNH endonuclease [Chryseobacterium sp.]|uniref:HNH endonuclease n=1 Tax=Chryseobacterium sp. TaxID=1871047 RepID=UPI0039170AD4